VVATSTREVCPVYPRARVACRPIHSTWPTGRRQSWHWGLAACGCPGQLSAAMVRGAAEAASGSSVKGGTDGAASSVASVPRVYEQVCRAWWAEIRSAVVWCGPADWAMARAKSVRVNYARQPMLQRPAVGRQQRASGGLHCLHAEAVCSMVGGSFDPGPSPATQPPQRPPFDPAASRPPCRTLLHSLALPAFRCFHNTRSRRTTSE